MVFCSRCGTAMEDSAPNCPNCGATQQRVANSNDTIMGILAYLGILVLIPILVEKNSRFVRFHANQGLVLFAFEVAYSVALGILSFVLGFIPVIGPLVISLLSLVSLVFLAFAILGIINVAKNEEKELPLIGHFCFLK